MILQESYWWELPKVCCSNNEYYRKPTCGSILMFAALIMNITGNLLVGAS